MLHYSCRSFSVRFNQIHYGENLEVLNQRKGFKGCIINIQILTATLVVYMLIPRWHLATNKCSKCLQYYKFCFRYVTSRVDIKTRQKFCIYKIMTFV